MNSKPIYLTRLDAPAADKAPAADEHAGLRNHFQALSTALHDAYRERYAGAPVTEDAITLLSLVQDFLAFMEGADAEFGPDGRLPQDDADLAAADMQRALAALESWMQRLDSPATRAAAGSLDTLIIGSALWTMRHALPLHVPEPLVNALARRANQAVTRQDVAAVYALMQGTVEHLKPHLGADLEQSNPERPWRILHLNFALTGIRSADRLLASHAFSAFNSGLPLERRGFYTEALELAKRAGLPQEMTALIETELAAASARH